MKNRLGQLDLEDLSAYLDGELEAGRAAEVERLIREDPLWRQAHRELTAVDAALDAYTAPTPPADMADRVLAGVGSSQPAEGLSAAELEDLSACLDGELGADRAAEVRRLVRDEPPWQRAHRELTAVDRALECYSVPAPVADLADRILAGVRRSARRRRAFRVAAWVGPIAAAAAVVLIVFAVLNRGERRPAGSMIVRTHEVQQKELDDSRAYRDVPKAERRDMDEVIIQNLGFFRNYELLEEFETLEAIERLESKGT
jgi:anti-sigma factor RsiW